ncbi:MAG: carbonic anhydrase [Hyphomicrobiaceae bacterium]
MSIPARLLTGYNRFRSMRYPQEAALYETVALHHSPSIMVIACADSRVDPATIFAARPGELFVVRNVAALVPPYEETGTYHGTSAAIEYAVTALEVEDIVVLGHGMCGGVEAALRSSDNAEIGRFIGPWVSLLYNDRDSVKSTMARETAQEQQRALERLTIKRSLSNLITFPFVASALNEEKLSLHGAWFSIAEGQLHWLNKDTQNFEKVGS